MQSIVHCNNEVRSVADHNLVETVVRLSGKVDIKLEMRKRKWKDLNVQEFKLYLEGKNWDEILESEDPDIAYSLIEEKLTEALDRFIPVKKFQIRKDQKSWITSETRQLMLDRENARNEAVRSNDDQDWKTYRRIRNKVKDKVKNDKKRYLKNTLDKAENEKDVKNTFRIAKDLLGWKSGGPPTAIVSENKLLLKPREVAEVMIK